jgi:hypothetical protein
MESAVLPVVALLWSVPLRVSGLGEPHVSKAWDTIPSRIGGCDGGHCYRLCGSSTVGTLVATCATAFADGQGIKSPSGEVCHPACKHTLI